MEERQLSLAEAAQRMGISERTARRWIKSGKLRAYKPGRDYWIPESALRELLEQSEVYPKVQSPLWSDEEPGEAAAEQHLASLIEACVRYIEQRADHYEREAHDPGGTHFLDVYSGPNFQAEMTQEIQAIYEFVSNALLPNWRGPVREGVFEDLKSDLEILAEAADEVDGRVDDVVMQRIATELENERLAKAKEEADKSAEERRQSFELIRGRLERSA